MDAHCYLRELNRSYARLEKRDRNPNRTAARKAVRAAIDAGRREGKPVVDRDGARCRVTGLCVLGDTWVTATEYGEITGIDG